MYVLYSLLTMFTICLTICILDKSNYLWFDDCIWSKSRWGRILYYKACLIKYINYSTNNTLSPKIYLTQSKPSRLRKCIVIHIHLSANYCHHKKFRSENLNIHSVTNRRGLSSFKHDVSNTIESDTKLYNPKYSAFISKAVRTCTLSCSFKFDRKIQITAQLIEDIPHLLVTRLEQYKCINSKW